MPDMIPAQHSRHFLLLEGELEDCFNYFLSLSQALKDPLLVASDTTIFDQITKDDGQPEQTLSRIPNSKLKQHLGHNHEAVFMDIEQGLSANAISLIAGTIKGAGLFVLSLRHFDTWLTQQDCEQARYLPWPLTHQDAKPYFKRYFLDKLALSNVKHIKLVKGQLAEKPLAKLAQHTNALTATQEQTDLINQVQRFARTSVQAHKVKASQLIIAHRGRGKSTALGMALAQLTNSALAIRFAITGPNKAALSQLETSYRRTLKDQESALEPLFLSPDSLIHSPKPLDFLIVDEAAALPLPMLKTLFDLYHQLIFSSTNHGYEGAGKGFGIKFTDYLKQEGQKMERLTLNEPVRWAKGDKLEAFIDALLLLDNHPRVNRETRCSDKLEIQEIKHGAWAQQSNLLSDCFSLLVSAHYQTSPDDIRWILDDPSVNTWILADQSQIVSTAILTEEGQLDKTLAHQVARGTRRPRGHLLPQSLLAHEGHLDAGNHSYWRISRIASQSLKQNQGHASHLLEAICHAGEAAKLDFICSSFAANHEVLNFWQKNGFLCVRLGTTRDQASGCYSVMMIKALNQAAQLTANLYHRHFLSNTRLNLAKDYPDIDAKLAQKLLFQAPCIGDSTAQSSALFEQAEQHKDQQDLALFAHHHRPYATIRAQLYRGYLAQGYDVERSDEEAGIRLLREAITKPIRDANFTQFKLNSKKAVDKALRMAVAQYLL
jgi:tRNA(Met) cytidine acetyltransferase